MTLSIVSLRAVALFALTAGVPLHPGEALATTGGWALREAPQQAQGAITGLVIEEATQRPISGVLIRIPGTAARASTDSEGRFQLLRVQTGTVVLRAQIIGYGLVEATVSVRAGQELTVNFEMTRRAIDLEEIVISVAGVEARRLEIGTDIERFDAVAEVERSAITSMSDLISGRAAGVIVTQGSGPVGTASTIRVRGVTSFSMAANPIIVIDGIRVSNESDLGPESVDWTEGRTISRLDDLNPLDIESVQIIKGPTATALYGAGAASGVMIIQTKRGRPGQHRVTVTTEAGIEEDRAHYWDKWYDFTKFMGITDVNDPVAQQWNAILNPVTGHVFGFHNPMRNPLTGPMRTGLFSNTTVSVSGGVPEMSYFVSARYQGARGPIPVSNLKQTSLRANIVARPSETLQISVNTNYLETDIQFPESTRSFRGYTTNAGVGNVLTSFGVRPDGSRGDCLATLERGDPESVCLATQGNFVANFDKLNTIFGGQKTGRFIGSVTAQWTPVSWLTNRLVGGVDYIQSRDLNEFPLDEDRPFGVLSLGFIRDARITDQNRTYEYTGTVTLNPEGVLASTTTLGAQYFSLRKETVSCIGEGGFASPTAKACDAALLFSGFSNLEENIQLGVYGQQRFGFRDYLFVTGGLRYDDNSAFGVNQGGIFSPSINASAVLSEMPFWNVGPINSLRLRLAWGQAAQAPPTSAALQRLLPVRLELGGQQVTGISTAFPGNPELTAERKSEIEFGFDVGFFDDRFALKATHYRQKTRDAIVTRFLPPSFGFRGEQWINVGGLKNNGFEVFLGANLVNSPSFTWDVEFFLSTQNPIITDMGGFPPLLLGTNRGLFMEGQAPGSYYGPIVERAERNHDGQIVPGSVVIKPGDLGLASNPELSLLGNPQPRDFENLSTNISLFGGRLRVATRFDRKGAVDKVNGDDNTNVSVGRDFGGQWQYVFREGGDCGCQARGSDIVTPEQQAGLEKSLVDGSQYRRFVFVEDGSFIKWRELSVTYQLPNSVLGWFGGESASITIGGRNLATWTRFNGVDPEGTVLGGRANLPANESFYGQAQTRRWFTRVQLAL